MPAKRLGQASGRAYALTVQCADASGNISAATTTVTVPRDQQ
jgi:hypothetical protein